jgi:anti-sigma B factor antagonist
VLLVDPPRGIGGVRPTVGVVPLMQRIAVMPEPFEIDVRPDRSRVVIALTGELDLATVDEARRTIEELRELGWRDFVVDLRGLSFLDSSGVHLLLETRERARDSGGSLTIVHGSPDVRRVLELTGVADRLEQARPRLR